MPETAQEIRERLRREGVSENVANEEHENLARRMASPNRGETAESIWASSIGNYKTRSQPNEIREESSGNSDGSGGGGGSQERWPQSPFESAYAESVRKQNEMLQQMWQAEQARDAERRAAEAERKARADSLYSTLLGRSQQATAVTPEDPVIKAQVDAYRAEQERGLRNFRSDSAEAGNRLRPTQDRMAAERVAQGTASMQAELLGRELSARRGEIADALSSMGGLLNADQTAGLQRELAGIDNLIRQQQLQSGNRDIDLRRELGLGDLGLGYAGLDVQRELGLGGLSNDLLRTMLQNQQFYGDLRLRDRTQDDYFNLVNRGRLGNPIR